MVSTQCIHNKRQSAFSGSKCYSFGRQFLNSHIFDRKFNFLLLLIGIPGLDLAPIDPIYVPEIKLEKGVAIVNCEQTFTNVTLSGFSNMKIPKVR